MPGEALTKDDLLREAARFYTIASGVMLGAVLAETVLAAFCIANGFISHWGLIVGGVVYVGGIIASVCTLDVADTLWVRIGTSEAGDGAGMARWHWLARGAFWTCQCVGIVLAWSLACASVLALAAVGEHALWMAREAVARPRREL